MAESQGMQGKKHRDGNPGGLPSFEGFSEGDMDLNKHWARIKKVEAEGDKAKQEVRKVREELGECKQNIEKLL